MQKKVLLYLPFKSDFYIGLYYDMKNGFEEAGCIVEGNYEYLESNELLQKIDHFNPDFVFEMNRTKSEIANFPQDLVHVCWLVDYWERTPSQINGSDILYLFSKPWMNLHDNFNGKILSILYPATNTDKYFIKNNNSVVLSMIMLGHIPKPWTEKELNREIKFDKGRTLLFSQLLKYIQIFTISPEGYEDIYPYLEYKLEVEEIQKYLDGVIHYDIDARAFREARRFYVVNNTLKFFPNINLYGNKNWLLRDEFKSRYKGYLSTREKMNDAFNQHRFLLQDNSIPHFRVFDAMAAGLIVLKPSSKDFGFADEYADFDFREGTEIFTYDLKNIQEVIERIMNLSVEDIMNTQYKIREKIKQSHTWKHRAQQVLIDVSKLKKLYINS